ncbi:hypothetical protein MJO29_006447 [Puccinia striiformis f. sp. tritici]|nr:hypothetical protein MJO29_006447 [Puccinia striiformis f. sp. tritici]
MDSPEVIPIETDADLFLTTSRGFSDGWPDYLTFTGCLSGRRGPWMQARPNRRPDALLEMRAEGKPEMRAGVVSLMVNVIVSLPDEIRLDTGRSYALKGNVCKLDDGITAVLEISQMGPHRSIPGGEMVELGPLIIAGLGSIANVKYLPLRSVENPTLELKVNYQPQGNVDGQVEVRWILAMGRLNILHNTNFRLGWRIALVGD